MRGGGGRGGGLRVPRGDGCLQLWVPDVGSPCIVDHVEQSAVAAQYILLWVCRAGFFIYFFTAV